MENPIIFTAEIIGTIAFASSGAMLGIRKNLDLFGVLVLGLCVAVGGGIVRDIILGRTPPGAFRDPVYALVALGTSALLFLLVYGKQEIMKQVFPLDEKMMLRRMSKGMQKQAAFWLAVCCMPEYLILDEPVGLGIFTVLGVYTAHSEGYHGIFFLVFLGMMTGIGGGLIRDILADTMPFILYKHIYAMAAFAGALVCVLLIHIHLYLALAAGTAVVIVIRVLATHYCWDLPRPLHEKDAHTKTKILSENSNADDT